MGCLEKLFGKAICPAPGKFGDNGNLLSSSQGGKATVLREAECDYGSFLLGERGE